MSCCYPVVHLAFFLILGLFSFFPVINSCTLNIFKQMAVPPFGDIVLPRACARSECMIAHVHTFMPT